MKRYAALFDAHWGYERKNGHKVAMHDPKAIKATIEFLKDFKPHALILGGDWLDCGVISHHNHNKPGRTEGLRLQTDAEECARETIKPFEALKAEEYYYIIGNHEDWLNDLTDDFPGLEGLLDVRKLLNLNKKWKVIPQGGYVNLGKLTFVHGDQISGGDHCAKSAVIAFERSVRFGHHHTFQTYTKTSALNIKLGRTGVAVPALCTKDPKYGEGKANRWQQGFNYGYILEDGTFRDYVAVIINGVAVVNGKVYHGD